MKFLRLLNLFVIFTIFRTVTCENILIIGAGASGLAAATKLIENNVTDFLILEAEPRLGGRIHSIYLTNSGKKGGNVDLGAEYVGGEIGNVIYGIAQKDLVRTNHSKKIKSFNYNGDEIDHEIVDEVLKFKENLRNDFTQSPPVSAEEAFYKKYNSTILKKYQNDEETHQKFLDLINVVKDSFLYRQGAFDWSKILLNDHYKTCEGDQGLNWNGKGFKHFLNLLMNKFGDEHRLRLFPIIYNTEITKIVWKNQNRVVNIQTKSGKKFECDHVIFTPSLGVLKENHENLFEPKLPQNKIEAIQNTGFEGGMKVILQFPKKWWDEDLSSFIFVWKNEDEQLISNKIKEKDKTWMRSFYRLFTVNGVENVLIGWFVGPQVAQIEQMANSELKSGISFILKKFLGKKYNVLEPSLIIPSSWYSNPHFRGVYSFETLKSAKKSYQKDLGEPLSQNGAPKILFAGEHTHPTHFSTAHGAVESGSRAAEELLNFLRTK